jgi:hypothetical protein
MKNTQSLFTALGLQNLSEKEKQAYIKQIHQIVLAQIIKEENITDASQITEALITRYTLKLKKSLIKEWQDVRERH